MKSAPHHLGELELNFYFADAPTEIVKLNDFVRAIIPLGVKVRGARQRDDYATIVSLTTSAYLQNAESDNANYQTIFVDTPMGLTLPGYSDTVTTLIELVPNDLKGKIIPAITLVTNYFGIFDQGISPFQPTPEIDAAGQRVMRFFLEIVKRTLPDYAAITIENGLPCPEELRMTMKRAGAFHDFYLSRSYMGEHNIQLVKDMFDGAYIADLEMGTYISCSGTFNPKRIWLSRDKKSPGKASRVGRIIADLHRHPAQRNNTIS